MQLSVQWNFAILHPDLADRSKFSFEKNFIAYHNKVVYLDAVHQSFNGETTKV